MPRWRRTIAIGVVAGLAMVAAFAVGYIAFFPQLIVVYGPSMAETLRGTHGELQCRECKFTFRFDAESAPVPSRLVCPNCGHIHVDDTSVRIRPPDRLKITPFTSHRQPQRFDLVSHYVPDFPEKQAVKRIIGLPGETVAIRQGEVFINGQPLGTPNRGLRVLVHDSSYLGQRERWHESSGSSAWKRFQEDLRYDPRSGQPRDFAQFVGQQPQPASDFAWLVYRHYPPIDLPRSAIHPQPITDFDAYNPTLSRELNPEFNLQMEGYVVFESPDAIVAWRLHDGWRWWQLEFDKPAHQVRLRCHDEVITEQPLPAEFGEEGVAGQASQYAWWSINAGEAAVLLQGSTQTGQPLRINITPPAPTGPREPQLDQVAVGIRQGRVRLGHLRVYRDIHYLAPDNTGRPWSLEQPLGPDEYFLLGDNPPVSMDSRHFGPVPRQDLRGIVEKRD